MTKEQYLAAIEVTIAVGEVIQVVSPIPSGELYARLAPTMSLAVYQVLLENLQKAKLIRVKNHLVTWIGPPAKLDS